MKKKVVNSKISRDISWLAFNARVLQEATDPTVSIADRLRFLGIFSNNLDEFFRVRVATLNRMVQFGKQAKMYMESKPAPILKQIQTVVLEQQKEFNRIYNEVQAKMRKEGVIIITEKQLNKDQKKLCSTILMRKFGPILLPL